MTDTIRGKWINPPNKLAQEMNKTLAVEVAKRLNAIHKLIMEAYPIPTGADAGWGGIMVNTTFADKVKFEMNQNGMLNEERVKTNPVSELRYNLILYPYRCGRQPNEIENIFPIISGNTGMSINANNLTVLNSEILPWSDMTDEMTIEGRPIKYKMPIMTTWKGYDVLTQEGGSNAALFDTHYMLISRKGMLPYIPVTRKQYLDRAIAYVTKTYDSWIASADKIPDKDQAAESKKVYIKSKEDALKKYQDALEESTKNGLLESPAIVLTGLMVESLGEIFSTEAKGGRMLATENPNYFRKDLPKYVPQFFILRWGWGNDPWSLRFRNAIEENFPIEKIQEMIDK